MNLSKKKNNVGLLPAHSYTILKIAEVFGERVLNIRNPFN
jgi:hypothetical protein